MHKQIRNIHKVQWCPTCKSYMVVCGHCGNNCCNGGNGENCVDNCNSAYHYQSVMRLNVFQKLREWFTIKVMIIETTIECWLNKFRK